MTAEWLTNPAVVGVAASILFQIVKATGWLDATRDEVRFVLAVALAGVSGALLVQDPTGAWSYVVAFGQAASAAVLAYNGWKNLVRRWLKRVLGWDVDLIEEEEAHRKLAEGR